MAYLRTTIATLLLAAATAADGRSHVSAPDVRTLQTVVNNDWLSPPVMRLGTDDVLTVEFDQLSHDYHRYVYRLEHCEADWTPSADLFESDWLEGFNNNPIEDYENSLNTTVLYTHYRIEVPNDRCRLKLSGNYRLYVSDEDDADRELLCAEFCVVEPLMNVGLSVTTNTDAGFNSHYQQVDMTLNYGGSGLSITDERSQLWTVVRQNAREDNQKLNPKPAYRQVGQLRWEHCSDLIFEAGGEYHKFEVLDVSHPTLGIDRMAWDGQNYQAYPFADEPRRNYVYDEDADGAFCIRNSDNTENERTCDYVWVNFLLTDAAEYPGYVVAVDGWWATGDERLYALDYDADRRCHHGSVLLKQGYYSYQYLLRGAEGATRPVPEEGSFFETENRYEAFVYYRGTTDRTWRLTGYQQVVLR